MYHHKGKWILIGVISYGYGCGQEDMPSVYARFDFTEQKSKLNIRVIGKFNAKSCSHCIELHPTLIGYNGLLMDSKKSKIMEKIPSVSILYTYTITFKFKE